MTSYVVHQVCDLFVFFFLCFSFCFLYVFHSLYFEWICYVFAVAAF